MGRRLLVTGGSGFTGANVVRYWLGRHPGDRVVVLGALTRGGNAACLAGLDADPRSRFGRGDVRDGALAEALLGEEAVDTIVHFAAESLRTFVRDRRGHDRRYAVDIARAGGELGFTSAVAFGDGLRRTLDWYLADEAWWGALLAAHAPGR